MTAPTMAPNVSGVPGQRVRTWGPFFRIDIDQCTTYSVVLIIPFTRRRASLQWQLVVFPREVKAS